MVRSIYRERRRLFIHSALFGLGAGVLASCTTNEPRRPPQTSAVRSTSSRPEVSAERGTAPRPARKPTPPQESGNPASLPGKEGLAMTGPKPTASDGGRDNSTPSSDPAALPTAPGRSGQISSEAELIGLDQAAATRLLGPATERSDEPPAAVWRYKTASCELDLFFYLDLRSGRMRTLHYTLKGESVNATQHQDCFRSLTASRER